MSQWPVLALCPKCPAWRGVDVAGIFRFTLSCGHKVPHTVKTKLA